MSSRLRCWSLVGTVATVALFAPARPGYAQTPTIQEQIASHEQKLKDAIAVKDINGQAKEPIPLGYLYAQIGERQKALDFFGQALPLLRLLGDRGGEAVTLNDIGSVYSQTGQMQKALEFYNQSLPIEREVDDRTDAAISRTEAAILLKPKLVED